MPQVTITDVKDVADLEDRDILRWISLHEKSLDEEGMRDYWDAISDDIKELKAEYDLRHPELVVLKEIKFKLEQIHSELNRPRPNTGPR